MSKYFSVWLIFLVNCLILSLVCGRIHNLKLQNDNRHRITLSTFGFLKGGTLAVNISLFTFKAIPLNEIDDKTFGFTLDKSNSPGLSNYVESMADCIWEKPENTLVSVFFKFDLQNNRMKVTRKGDALQHLKIVAEPRKQYLFDQNLEHGENLAAVAAATTKPNVATPAPTTKPDEKKEGDQKIVADKEKNANDDKVITDGKKKEALSRQSREATKENEKKIKSARDNKAVTEPVKGSKTEVKDDKTEVKDDKTENKNEDKGSNQKPPKEQSGALPDVPIGVEASDLETSLPMTSYSKDTMTIHTSYFLVHVRTTDEEGLYNLFFHNCHKFDSLINLTLQIIEDNDGNYLSADEMPIPVLYFVFHIVFLVLVGVWLSVLRRAEEGVYKLHYLMLVVVFVKSISCLFHGINMYMIQKNGIHVDAWAILWYIVYLTRGALMFVTVLLIGAGWAFIKHVFSDREKKLFLVVMPLQILANVAWVIVEESEEGTSSYTLWNRVFMVVDLLCCFAILFPVIWSIRHLQEASQTDGKAAINLNKLKLFRYFYILIVCYIYFTRIIVYLLKITLPFHYGWLRNLFAEVFLLCFFTLTGYKFRPTTDNPYLQVPVDSDDEIEMEEVLTKTGNMESLSRVNQGMIRTEEGEVPRTTVKQRESSHEFD